MVLKQGGGGDGARSDFLSVCLVRARYLGNHILTKSRLQLQPPLLAGAQHFAVVVPLPGGVVAFELRRGRVTDGADGRERYGPVAVVPGGLHARAVGLRQEEIIRKLAKADEQCGYPGQNHELLLVFPKAPHRRQNRAVDVWQQPGNRLFQRGEAILWRVVLRLRPADCHHGPATKKAAAGRNSG